MAKKPVSVKKQKMVTDIVVHVFLVIVAIVWLIPFIWIIAHSFRGESTGMYCATFFPKEFTFDNYIGLFTDMTDAEWDALFAVNVRSVFSVTKAVLPGMISRQAGAIVNVSSMWGEVGASCEVAYSATKAAIIGMTKALAKEVGPSGVRVNVVTPGVIDTDMNAQLTEDDRAALAEETPLGRIGSPEEVARTILFLCGEDAAFITGQVLGVSGGLVI